MIGTNMKKVIAILTCFILAFSPFVLNFYGLIDKDLFIACISLNISLAVFAFFLVVEGAYKYRNITSI